jgi:hypothetical protein
MIKILFVLLLIGVLGYLGYYIWVGYKEGSDKKE